MLLADSLECGVRFPELSGPIGRIPASRCTRCECVGAAAKGHGGPEALPVRGQGGALV